jgi:hypothetical protein
VVTEPETSPRSRSTALSAESPKSMLFGQSTPTKTTNSLVAPAGSAALSSLPAPTTASQCIQRITDIYTAHNTEKLHELPTLLAKYAGKEQELLSKVEKKYLSTAATTATAPTAAAVSTSLFYKPPSSSTTSASTSLFAPVPTGSSSSLSSLSSSLSTGFPNASVFAAPTASVGQSRFGTAFGSNAIANSGDGGGSNSLFPQNAGLAQPQQPPRQQQPQQQSLFGQSTSGFPLQQQPQSFAQRVEAIYRAHNPEKLSEVPHLLEKYRGKELELLARLEKKYGTALAGLGNTGGSGSSGMGGFGSPNNARKSLFGGANTVGLVGGVGVSPLVTSSGFGSGGWGNNRQVVGGSLFGPR